MWELIAAYWRLHSEALLLVAAIVALGAVVWTVRATGRQRLAERTWLEDELDRRQDEYRHALDSTRQDLIATLARSQVLTQESHQRGLNALQDGVDQRLARLQRQALEDAAGLKTDLVGRFEQLKGAIGEGQVGALRVLLVDRRQPVEPSLLHAGQLRAHPRGQLELGRLRRRLDRLRRRLDRRQQHRQQ